MIGYSVSFCVRDIADGRVSIADVEKVVAGVRCETDADWDAVIEQYTKVYWVDDRSSKVMKTYTRFRFMRDGMLLTQERRHLGFQTKETLEPKQTRFA